MSTGLGIGAAATVATIGTAAIGVAGATSALFGTAKIAESFTGKNGIKQYLGEPIYNQIYAGSMFISSEGLGAM